MTDRRFLDIHPVRIVHRERPDAEDALWECLRRRHLGTLRFHRLDPVGGVIPSFTCRERRLAIDVTDRNPVGDAELADRAARMRARGWWLMRVRGTQVLSDVDGVCDAVRRLCRLEDAVPTLRLVRDEGERR